MSPEQKTPAYPEALRRLLDAGNDLIAEGMRRIAKDNPEGHETVLGFSRAGAYPRLTVDSRPDQTTVSLDLIGADGATTRVFEFRSPQPSGARH